MTLDVMTMRYLFLIVTFVMAYVPLAYAASFDCSKASTTVEHMYLQ